MPSALALELPFRPEDVPWSFLMAFASLGLIYLLFRARADLFADLSFTGKEVALLCLGSIAGWAVNFPIWISGQTYVMANVGGAIVPIIVVAGWIRRRKLPVVRAAVATAIVAVVAWRVVRFEPQHGIISTYPWFFLPVALALVLGLVLSPRRAHAGVPIAYASGSIGALVGADLAHLSEIHAHFAATSADRTIISIGGAGVFDMVFLAGTSAMALHLGIAAVLSARGRRAPAAPARPYPGAALALRDSRRVADHFRALAHPNALDRALAGLALSNLALRDGDYGRSVRMSWLAVDNLLQAEPLRARLEQGLPRPVQGDLHLLQITYLEARSTQATLRQAGEANTAAKHLLCELAPQTGLRHQLEGVA
ncbi:MAG TPA: DUF1614 domain-containing protein [Candidatus Thermoplasmatota archaeon]|nr:DUF1614 domain-containing protein [Candidatus Thermoplasmatota archaeon]